MADSNVPGAPDRRVHPRLRPRSLAYVELGAGNGGIVLNVSEGGLAVAAAAPVAGDAGDAPTPVRFRLSPGTGWIEATGHLAWVGGSQKTVGIRFVDLAETNRSRLREWVSAQLAAVDAGPPAPAMPLHVPASFGRELSAPPPAVSDVAPLATPPAAAPPSPAEPPPIVAEPAESLPVGTPTVATPAIVPVAPAYPPQPTVSAAASAPAVAAPFPAPPRVPPVPPSPPVVVAARPVPPSSVAPMARPPAPAVAALGVPARFPTPVPPNALTLAMADGAPKRRARTTFLLGLLVCLVALLFFVIGIGTAGGSFSEMVARFAGTGAATRSLSPEQETAQSPVQQGAEPSASPAPSGNSGARVNSNGLPTGGAAPQRNAFSRNENERNETLQPPPESAPGRASPALTDTANRLPSLTARSTGTAAPSAPPALLAPAAAVTPPAAAAAAGPAVLSASAPAATPAAAPAIPSPTGAVDVIASPYPSIRIPPALSALASEPGMTLHLGALVSRVEPVYPQAAIEQGVQGVVQLRVLIGRDGAVSDVQLSSGGPDVLVEAARAAVRQWRYEPSQLGPQPVEAEERVTVTFRLMDPPARR